MRELVGWWVHYPEAPAPATISYLPQRALFLQRNPHRRSLVSHSMSQPPRDAHNGFSLLSFPPLSDLFKSRESVIKFSSFITKALFAHCGSPGAQGACAKEVLKLHSCRSTNRCSKQAHCKLFWVNEAQRSSAFGIKLHQSESNLHKLRLTARAISTLRRCAWGAICADTKRRYFCGARRRGITALQLQADRREVTIANSQPQSINGSYNFIM